jgi:diguanylate cyclase (GGDEF)-like protein
VRSAAIRVDHFKSFNDLYGHSAGDDALAAVARCIGENIRRPGDSAARYGGEEFAVVLPNTGHEGAIRIAESIRTAVQSLGRTHTASIYRVVTVSIGIACMTERRFAALLVFVNAADRALYDAKGGGRNRVVCESNLAEAHVAAPVTTPKIDYQSVAGRTRFFGRERALIELHQNLASAFHCH